MLANIIKEWQGVEVSAMDVYRDVFRLGEGYLQRMNEPSGEYKANPVAYWKNKDKDKGHFRVMFEDTFEETLKELQEADFAILNGISYFGRRNVQEHASKMYAMIFDLDGVTDKKLNAFLSGAFRADAYPIPNYIILSGHGVHLYYVMEEPIPLFPNIKLQLKEFKYALTEKLWNEYTSTLKEKQKQGINQGFRVIGGKTKDGAKEKVVRAFRMHTHPFSLSLLGRYVPEEHCVDEKKLFRESKITLEKAKEKYPEWYEKVVVQGNRQPKKWDIAGKVHGDNPYALYDWWKNQIVHGATYHHRYFNIMCLAIYGAKCDVPEEKVREDAYGLLGFMNGIQPDDPFTEADIESALECYDARYCTFPIRDISNISGIAIQKNVRNGRKQKDHVVVMNKMKEVKKFLGEDINEGRPDKKKIVEEWRKSHPNGQKADCIRDTGLSKPTVYKWWNGEDIDNDKKTEVPLKEKERFYVVEGSPDMMERMMEYASRGIRQVEIITQEEYEEMQKKVFDKG